MGMGGGGSRGQVQSEINVTPLIDVCLVLLVIMMVVTPMLQKGTAVVLPETKIPEELDEEGKMLVSVDAEKRLYVGSDFFPLESFKAKVKEEKAKNEGIEVLIKGHSELTYGDVLDVMKLLNDEKLTRVTLITKRTEKKQ